MSNLLTALWTQHTLHIVQICHLPSCSWIGFVSAAGKKDTPVGAVQAMTHEAGALPAGIDRVTSILAGRISLPVVDANQSISRSITTAASYARRNRGALWRGFAASTSLR